MTESTLIIRQLNHLGDESIIDSFVTKVDLVKFNLWQINDQDKVQFLQNEIRCTLNSGTVFCAIDHSEIIAMIGIQEMKWDSDFFNCKSGKVVFFYTTHELSFSDKKKAVALLANRLSDFLIKEKFAHCMADLPSMNYLMSEVLQAINFKYVLSWTDCFKKSSEQKRMLSEEYEISSITENELDYIVSLSKDYFKGGRFYLDSKFPSHKVDELYSSLVLNSINDSSIDIMVLRRKGDPIGAFLCKEISYDFSISYKVRSLRLLIFDKKKAVAGLATSFINDVAIELYSKYNCNLVASGIENHNLPSMKIHMKGGYKLNHTHNAYHWWSK